MYQVRALKPVASGSANVVAVCDGSRDLGTESDPYRISDVDGFMNGIPAHQRRLSGAAMRVAPVNPFSKFPRRLFWTAVSAIFAVPFVAGCGLQVTALSSRQAVNSVPTIAIRNFPLQILSENVASFSLSGDCGINTSRIDVSADSTVSATTTCTNNAWTVTLDLSSIPDGTGIVIETTHTSLDGSQTQMDSITIDKDTTVPTGGAVVVDAGNLNAPTTGVALTLAATGASEMYITHASGCASGGTWEPYATSKAWTLAAANASNVVYVKFRNAVGNESACVSDSIYSGTGTAVSEDFEDATLHPDFSVASPAVVSGGRLDIPAPVNTGGTSANSVQPVAYPALAHLDGATITMEVSQTTAAVSDQVQSFLYLADDPAWRGIYFLKEDTSLIFGYDSPGWGGISIPYDPVAHRWWRIRHDAATDWVYWETSPDGATWTTQQGMLAPADFTWMFVYLVTKTLSSQPAPGVFSIENFSITR